MNSLSWNISEIRKIYQKMKLAITIWGNRISPVFDSAKKLMIVSIYDSKIASRTYENCDNYDLLQIVSTLAMHKVKLLICGAITRNQTARIESNGIQVLSFISGHLDKILATYIKNPQQISDFQMPGTLTNVTRRNFESA